MSKKKSTHSVTEKQLKVIHLENYKRELDELKASGKTEYKPKIGRRIKQIEKKIKQVA